MAIPQLISRLAQIENTINTLFQGQFDGMDDITISWVVAPLDQISASNIYAWFDIVNSDITVEILSALATTLAGINQPFLIDNSSITSISTRLRAAEACIDVGSKLWEQLYKAREEIYLTPGGLNKEEFWLYRLLTERTKSSLVKNIISARIYLQEIIEILGRTNLKGQLPNCSVIKCPITGQSCNISPSKKRNQVFVAYQFESNYYTKSNLKSTISESLEKLGLTPYFPDEHFEPIHISCEICQALQQGHICIFEISDSNPNVLFELGLSYMLGKVNILLAKKDSQGTRLSDIAGIHRIQYDDLVECRNYIYNYLSTSEIVSGFLHDPEKGKVD